MAESEKRYTVVGTGIEKTFKSRGKVLGAHQVKALRGVDFAIEAGGAMSFIGESGCGKTTPRKALT